MGGLCIPAELNGHRSNRPCKSCGFCKDMERFIRPMVLEMHRFGVNGVSSCRLSWGAGVVREVAVTTEVP